MSLDSLKNIDSKEVFRWFIEISKIPRESGYEQEISDFLVKFAKERNLEVYQDKERNVIIKKNAFAGYENFKPLILQGHMDMVCEKTEDSKHDFRKDPIELIVEGDILKANNTTLGADDGIAIAFALALLDSDDIPHPALEVLITTEEETTMNGAFYVTSEHLSGKTLINIDSEEEGIFLVSCSGGISTIVDFDIVREPNNNDALKIEISGLKGGHSGMEIHNQRANAIKILSRILYYIKNDINIHSISGGSKKNAIAKNSEAVVTSKNIDKVKSDIEEISKLIKNEYKVEDPDIKISISKCSNVKDCFTKELTNNVIDFLMLAPDGVLYMSRDMKGLVQTSANNGILKEENGKLTSIMLIRSCIESSSNEIVSRVEDIALRTNAHFESTGGYPGWEYDSSSKVRDIALEVYKKVTGKDAKVDAIHAGLECGILKRVLTDVDMISVGPSINDVHTPREHLSISSVDRMWKFLKELIISIK